MKIIPKIGLHVSVAGGFYKGIEYANNIGLTAIQIFGSSPRQWKVKFPIEEDLKKYFEYKKLSKVEAVYLHAPYIANPASFDEELRNKSVKVLLDHYKIAFMLDAEGLILHLGSGKDNSKEKAIDNLVLSLKEILSSEIFNKKQKTKILLENSASSKKVGYSIDELSSIFKAVNSKQLGLCIDTAHALGSGMIQEYTKESVKKLFDEIDEQIGLERLEVIHTNDSKVPANSNNDRHEHIGRGFIGLKGFQALAGDERLREKSWILETPKEDDKDWDKENVAAILDLFK